MAKFNFSDERGYGRNRGRDEADAFGHKETLHEQSDQGRERDRVPGVGSDMTQDGGLKEELFPEEVFDSSNSENLGGTPTTNMGVGLGGEGAGPPTVEAGGRGDYLGIGHLGHKMGHTGGRHEAGLGVHNPFGEGGNAIRRIGARMAVRFGVIFLVLIVGFLFARSALVSWTGERKEHWGKSGKKKDKAGRDNEWDNGSRRDIDWGGEGRKPIKWK